MPTEIAPPPLHRLDPGAELHLPLAEGTELFCRQGRLRLICDRQGWADGVAPAAIVLSTGQGWRAQTDLQVRVSALSGACLQLHGPQMPPGRNLQEERVRPAQWALAGWLRSLRRGRRAA